MPGSKEVINQTQDIQSVQKSKSNPIFDWISKYKKISAFGVFIALAIGLYNVVTIVKDLFDLNTWLLENWNWLVGLSKSNYFPWIWLVVCLVTFYLIVKREANADYLNRQQSESIRIDSLAEVQKLIDNKIDERLGKYDKQLNAYFFYQTETKRNDELRELCKQIKVRREHATMKLSEWPHKEEDHRVPSGAQDRNHEFLSAFEYTGCNLIILDQDALKDAMRPRNSEVENSPEPPGFHNIDYEPLSKKYRYWYCQILRVEKLAFKELNENSHKLQDCRILLNL